MENLELTLSTVEHLVSVGSFYAADLILRPHCRYPSPMYIDRIIDLETQIVDALISGNVNVH